MPVRRVDVEHDPGCGCEQVDGVETVDVQVVWDPVWTMDRLSDSARAKLAMPLEQLEPLGRSAA